MSQVSLKENKPAEVQIDLEKTDWSKIGDGILFYTLSFMPKNGTGRGRLRHIPICHSTGTLEDMRAQMIRNVNEMFDFLINERHNEIINVGNMWLSKLPDRNEFAKLTDNIAYAMTFNKYDSLEALRIMRDRGFTRASIENAPIGEHKADPSLNICFARWQNDDMKHDFTCGKNSDHGKLYMRSSDKELWCVTCGWQQKVTPAIVRILRNNEPKLEMVMKAWQEGENAYMCNQHGIGDTKLLDGENHFVCPQCGFQTTPTWQMEIEMKAAFGEQSSP